MRTRAKEEQKLLAKEGWGLVQKMFKNVMQKRDESFVQKGRELVQKRNENILQKRDENSCERGTNTSCERRMRTKFSVPKAFCWSSLSVYLPLMSDSFWRLPALTRNITVHNWNSKWGTITIIKSANIFCHLQISCKINLSWNLKKYPPTSSIWI